MRERRGFTIIFVLGIISLVMLVIITLSLIASNDLTSAGTITDVVRAHYIADAGLAKKFMDLRSGDTANTSGTITLATGLSGTFSVATTLVQAGTFQTYRLDSTGTYRNASRTLSLTIRQISFARYAYLSNSEDQLFWWGSRPIWFVTGDLLKGPLHSNDQLNISGDPVFDGPVTSVAATLNYYNGGPPNDNPDFRESLTLGAPSIQLPLASEIVTPLRTAAQQPGGLYLTGNTIITLMANGTMNVTNAAIGWSDQNVPLPSNNVLFVDNGYVDISGILSGQLTVGTNRNIYVVNNLLYANDPRVNPSSTDMLGLVSQNSVYVDAATPYDLEIDAYIVALNTSFAVENYQTGLKGILTIYGGLTQERRGPIGTFNATTHEKVSGYTKDYNYDTRLAASAPPYFPPARDSNGRVVYIKVLWAEN